MTEQEIIERLDVQDAKLDAIYTSTEKTRKYFLWTLIISVAMIVLPIIGLVIAVPLMMDAMFGGVADVIAPQQGQFDPASMNALIEELSATTKILQ